MLAIFLTAAALAVAGDTTPRWAQVSVGGDHACALDGGGRAFCWGSNHAAQLGAATSETCGIVGESGHRGCYPAASDTPVAAAGSMRFASILAGRYRTCALDAEGRAFCWGADVTGPGATCLNGRRCSSVPVAYEPEHRFRRLAGGSRVICGITRGDQALCTNLLNGDRWWELRAMRAERAGTPMRDVAALSDYPIHNVCLVDGNGAAWCRGSNHFGQLGAAGATAGAPPGSFDEADSLVRIAGDAKFKSLAVQAAWICGLSEQGQAFCWGLRSRHDPAQGVASGADRCGSSACTLVPVPIGGRMRFREIAAHHERVCGLTDAGQAYCWRPTRGQPHANASDDYEVTPQQPDLRFRALAGDLDVGMGSCGITLRGDAIYCWGGANQRARRMRIADPVAAR